MSEVAYWSHTSDGLVDRHTGVAATCTRAGVKTIERGGRIYDVPANTIATRPWGEVLAGGRGWAGVYEGAATNYLLNSHGAANDGSKWTTEWLYAGSGRTDSLVDGAYSDTAWNLYRVMESGDSYWQAYTDSAVGTFAEGDSATLSVYEKRGAETAYQVRTEILARDSGSSVLGNVMILDQTIGTEFTRIGVTYSSLPATTSFLRATTVAGVPVEGSILDWTIDAVQLEKQAFASSYIPTTTAAVTRNADVVTVPTTGWNAAAGTIAMASVLSPYIDSFRYLLRWYGDANNTITMYTAGSMTFGVEAGGVFEYDEVAEATGLVVGTWDSENAVEIYMNGVAGARSNSTGAPVGLGATATIGSSTSATVRNSYIADIAIHDTALSAAEILARQGMLYGRALGKGRLMVMGGI
jgi:hypothetical protein